MRTLAQLTEGTDEEREAKASFIHEHRYTNMKATARTIGLLFSEKDPEGALSGQLAPC